MKNNIYIFISTPISGFSSASDYSKFREWFVCNLNQLRNANPCVNIYCAAEHVDSHKHMGKPFESTRQDIVALDRSQGFILFYPEKIASSALIELGYALAKNTPILIVTPSKSVIPFMATAFDELYSNVKTLEIKFDNNSIHDLIIAYNELVNKINGIKLCK